MFKSLVKFIQKTYDITIRCCRLDNEFENGPIGRWCDSHAIAREHIEPYAHYQNGVAERTNRTIRETAAPMVQETSISGQVSRIISEKGTELLRMSSIPENLWPEAIQHSVWLKNRTPARALRKTDVKTPYEALKGEKPTLTRGRIWGSRAYVTYPPEFRNRAEMTKLHVLVAGWVTSSDVKVRQCITSTLPRSTKSIELGLPGLKMERAWTTHTMSHAWKTGYQHPMSRSQTLAQTIFKKYPIPKEVSDILINILGCQSRRQTQNLKNLAMISELKTAMMREMRATLKEQDRKLDPNTLVNSDTLAWPSARLSTMRFEHRKRAVKPLMIK